MKKILALLMPVCMMLALLTGCGSAPAETPQTPAEQPVAEKPAEKETVALKVWADQVELELMKSSATILPLRTRKRNTCLSSAPSAP